MALEQRLSLKLSQKLVMTQSLQQAIKLLQMSRLELQETVQQELLENPVLEDRQDGIEVQSDQPSDSMLENETQTFEDKLDQIDMESYFQDYLGDYQPRQEREAFDSADLPSFENVLTKAKTLTDYLYEQLGVLPLSEAGYRIGAELIGNINDAGRLTVGLEDIAASGDWKLEEVEAVFQAILEFEPLGVGARNLRECLAVQLAYSEWAGTEVESILLDHFVC